MPHHLVNETKIISHYINIIMDEEFKVNMDRMALLVIGMAGTGKTTFVNVSYS